MTTPFAEDILATLRSFVARIDALDPSASSLGTMTVAFDDTGERFHLSGPVATALTEALLNYRDPRDLGPCEHCGAPGLDEYFRCGRCGVVNGVFGQILAERATRYPE